MHAYTFTVVVQSETRANAAKLLARMFSKEKKTFSFEINPPVPKEKAPGFWANVFLEDAARETAWMRQAAGNCDYAAARDSEVRRGTLLLCALKAQEQGK